MWIPQSSVLHAALGRQSGTGDVIPLVEPLGSNPSIVENNGDGVYL